MRRIAERAREFQQRSQDRVVIVVNDAALIRELNAAPKLVREHAQRVAIAAIRDVLAQHRNMH